MAIVQFFSMKLIVVNYSMSPDSLVFSHQRETVTSLAPLFESITVFTSETSLHPLPKNVTVVQIPWYENSSLLNFFKIIQFTFPFMIKNRNSILFNHMTDVHAAIMAPLARILRIKHVLWYAHAHNSIYLIWSSFFLSHIVSSTPGSCNLKVSRKKITFINQGIRQADFPFKAKSFYDLKKLFYYGRLDQSKNIHLLHDLVIALNQESNLYTLDIFGKTANIKSEAYMNSIEVSTFLTRGIRFHGAIARKAIPKLSVKFGVFINLFTGSLDKTLIENTFMGIPVVTWNLEYCSEFGTWSGEPVSTSLDFIVHEILFLQSMEYKEIQQEILNRLDAALKNHSFDGWIVRLVSVLKGGGKE